MDRFPEKLKEVCVIRRITVVHAALGSQRVRWKMIVCAAGLLITSYIYMAVMIMPWVWNEPLFEAFDEKIAEFITILIILSLLIIVFSILNMICGLSKLKKMDNEKNQKKSLRAAFLIKIFTFPMLCFNFYFGVSCFIFGMFFIVTLPLALLAVIVAYGAMLSSSCYAIPLMLHAGKKGIVSKTRFAVLFITQFICVIDIIGFLVFRKDYKKAVKERPEMAATGV